MRRLGRTGRSRPGTRSVTICNGRSSYDLLPAGERARIHARVGARLEQAYAHDDGAAGLLAWHFARARDAVKAITYLGTAAEQALRKNAHQEAVGHLSDALGLLDRLPAGRERDERELALLTTLGTTQVTVRGYSDPAVRETYARARQVSTRLGDVRIPTGATVSGPTPSWGAARRGARRRGSSSRIVDELDWTGRRPSRAPSRCRCSSRPVLAAACLKLSTRSVAQRRRRRQALLDLDGEETASRGRMNARLGNVWVPRPPRPGAEQSADAMRLASEAPTIR